MNDRGVITKICGGGDSGGPPLLVHGVLIDHKTNLALAADRRDHIDPLPRRLHRQHGRTALWGKAALYNFTVAYAGLTGPIEDGIFCFRAP